MIGSTLMHEREEGRLAKIEVDDLDNLTIIELNALSALDFQLMASEVGLSWAEKRSLRYDEEHGLAIFKVSPEAIRFVVGRSGDLNEHQQADLEELRHFIDQHGTDSIYEFATF